MPALDPIQRRDRRLTLSASLFSVTVALTLVAAKIWALAETRALSVAATLADSGLDLLMSLGGLAALAYASKPADDDHAFGHSSAEDLAALGQALFILVSAALIAVTAVLRLGAEATPLRAEQRGIGVMAFSIALTLALVAWQRYVVRRTESRVVRADSLHYLGDLVPNVGAIGALWASAALGIGWVDPVVALVAAAILAVGAGRIGRGAWDALMDRAADPATVTRIEAIAARHPGVQGFHDLKTRRSGSRLFVNLHIELDGDQSLHAAHRIGAGLRREIIDAFPRAEVIIHKDPVGVERHPDDPRP